MAINQRSPVRDLWNPAKLEYIGLSQATLPWIDQTCCCSDTEERSVGVAAQEVSGMTGFIVISGHI